MSLIQLPKYSIFSLSNTEPIAKCFIYSVNTLGPTFNDVNSQKCVSCSACKMQHFQFVKYRATWQSFGLCKNVSIRGFLVCKNKLYICCIYSDCIYSDCIYNNIMMLKSNKLYIHCIFVVYLPLYIHCIIIRCIYTITITVYEAKS